MVNRCCLLALGALPTFVFLVTMDLVEPTSDTCIRNPPQPYRDSMPCERGRLIRGLETQDASAQTSFHSKEREACPSTLHLTSVGANELSRLFTRSQKASMKHHSQCLSCTRTHVRYCCLRPNGRADAEYICRVLAVILGIGSRVSNGLGLFEI